MGKYFVLVAGNIGAGKTSLTEILGEQLDWQTAYESVVDNPYLADFYQDMRQWAFHLQVFFLGHRAEQHMNLARASNSAIIDRSIYEDAEIFARAALKLGTITERDYWTYRKIFDLVIATLPSPDLLLYLRTPVPVLMDRIRARGREMEKSITDEYLQLLDSLYEEWIAKFDLCPVLKIPPVRGRDNEVLDFVHKPRHMEIVINHIIEKLAGKEEIRFPLENG
jgi:deoxyadenosine/deoxycytidine kinase